MKTFPIRLTTTGLHKTLIAQCEHQNFQKYRTYIRRYLGKSNVNPQLEIADLRKDRSYAKFG